MAPSPHPDGVAPGSIAGNAALGGAMAASHYDDAGLGGAAPSTRVIVNGGAATEQVTEERQR
eukprot:8041585-Alexandrium_andersonii.AAC.1